MRIACPLSSVTATWTVKVPTATAVSSVSTPVLADVVAGPDTDQVTVSSGGGAGRRAYGAVQPRCSVNGPKMVGRRALSVIPAGPPSSDGAGAITTRRPSVSAWAVTENEPVEDTVTTKATTAMSNHQNSPWTTTPTMPAPPGPG